MIHIIEPRPLGYCPARNVSTMLVHQVHVISRHITATDIVSTILAITEIRSAFHQTMSSTLYQLGHVSRPPVYLQKFFATQNVRFEERINLRLVLTSWHIIGHRYHRRKHPRILCILIWVAHVQTGPAVFLLVHLIATCLLIGLSTSFKKVWQMELFIGIPFIDGRLPAYYIYFKLSFT